MVTINFSHAGVRLLIKGGFINFGVILPSAIHKNSYVNDWFMRTALQIINIRLISCHAALEPGKGRLLPSFTACSRGYTHMHAVTIQGQLVFGVWLLFE